MLKQLLIQKKQSLEYERGLITQKWNNVEDNIKNVFRKLAMELQER